jgi:hypothetical protein
MRRFVLAATAMAALAVPAVSMANADTTAPCKQGGWQNLVRQDGTGFKNQGDCVSYAAQGGLLKQAEQAETLTATVGGDTPYTHTFHILVDSNGGFTGAGTVTDADGTIINEDISGKIDGTNISFTATYHNGQYPGLVWTDNNGAGSLTVPGAGGFTIPYFSVTTSLSK